MDRLRRNRIGQPGGEGALVVLGELVRLYVGCSTGRRGQGQPGEQAGPATPAATEGDPNAAAVPRVLLEPLGDFVDPEAARADFEALLGLRLGCRQGREQPLPQHPELQIVEQGMHPFAVPRLPGEVGDFDVQWHVTNQLGELAIAHHRSQVLAKRIAHLALDGVYADDQRVERSELAHPLSCRLLPHPRNAGQVVARIASKRSEIGVLGRRQPILRDDLLRRESRQIAHPPARVEHGDRVGDQLQHVPIAGADEHLDAFVGCLRGQGRDHVVGFVSLDG